MIIRKETLEDVKYVNEIADTAFNDFDYRCSFIETLRRSGNYLHDLFLVCENDDGIISGHIMFCEVEIGQTKQAMLASLCVASNMKNKGIGRKLLAEGHRIADKLGYKYIIAFDSTGYLEKKLATE